MLVRVLKKHVEGVGRLGETRYMPPDAALLLILVGLVEQVRPSWDNAPPPLLHPQEAAPDLRLQEDAPESPPPKKARYERRDMRASDDDRPAPRARKKRRVAASSSE